MAASNKRPIIFPLSNPVDMCEVTYEDAIKWSVPLVLTMQGQALTFLARIIGPMEGLFLLVEVPTNQ